jgi:hypothetical protein
VPPKPRDSGRQYGRPSGPGSTVKPGPQPVRGTNPADTAPTTAVPIIVRTTRRERFMVRPQAASETLAGRIQACAPRSGKSSDQASLRIRQVFGSGKSSDQASLRIRQVFGSCESSDQASPRIKQVLEPRPRSHAPEHVRERAAPRRTRDSLRRVRQCGDRSRRRHVSRTARDACTAPSA